jgi:RHS repeat-associated protein
MDKLSQVQTPATTIDYAYDALGRRIQRSEGTGTVNYHYYRDTDLVDYRTDETGTLTASYLRGAGGLIASTDYSGQSPETSYYLFNPHGDTTAIADANGTVTSSYRYDAFGNELNGNSPEYGYTGRWQRTTDSATQNIQMGAREYDPALGRFTSPDPLRGSIFDSQQRNRYSYTGNDPLTRYDLNGMWWGGDAWNAISSTASDIWNDWSEGVDIARNMYWEGYKTMPKWAQYADTGVILGGTAFLDLYSVGALTPVQGEYVSELAEEETAISLERGGAECEAWAEWTGKIEFRSEHAARHLAGTGLNTEEVQLAIEKSIRQDAEKASSIGNYWGRVNIGGREIEYRAYLTKDGYINVGTYYPLER